MTDNDKRLDEELRSVLGDGSLDPEDREAMAREALSGAERLSDRPAPRRWAALMLPAAAVLAAVLAVLAFTGDDDPAGTGSPTRDAIPAAEGSVAEARKMNEAALADPEVRKLLAEVPKGSWAVIAHGVLVCTGAELNPLLATARMELPDARHRFVFRVGEEGDKSYGLLAAPFEKVVGTRFRKAVGLVIGMDPDLLEHIPAELIIRVATIRVGPPRAEDGVANTYRVDLKYDGPLVLPKDKTFPLFEIPGRAHVTAHDGAAAMFRRFLVRVRIPEHGIDVLVEALGESAESIARDLSFWRLPLGYSWKPFGDEVMAESKRTGKPILLLTGNLKNVPHKIFMGEMFKQVHDRFVLASAVAPPEHPPFEWKGATPHLTAFFPEGDEPKNFKVGETLVLGKDVTKNDMLVFLMKSLMLELVPGVRYDGPHPLPEPLTLEDQLKMLREIEKLVKDPEALKKIRKHIADLEKKIAEK